MRFFIFDFKNLLNIRYIKLNIKIVVIWLNVCCMLGIIVSIFLNGILCFFLKDLDIIFINILFMYLRIYKNKSILIDCFLLYR